VNLFSSADVNILSDTLPVVPGQYSAKYIWDVKAEASGNFIQN
jgi:hypothetical protein